jgi:hypothetical protein
VVTDRLVFEGEVLEPTKDRQKALSTDDYKLIKAQVDTLMSAPRALDKVERQKEAILTAVASVQAQFNWDNSPHLIKLRSDAVAVILRAALASCLGELRHWHTRNGPGMSWPDNMLDVVKVSSCNRARIYRWAFLRSITPIKIATLLSDAGENLAHPDWHNSYGGRKWAMVADAGVTLAKAMDSFTNDPCRATWSKVIRAANILINTSHNGGKCLTKWLDSVVFSAISSSPTVGFLNPYLALTMLGYGDNGENK